MGQFADCRCAPSATHKVDDSSRLAHGFCSDDSHVHLGHDVADCTVQDDDRRNSRRFEDGLSLEAESELPTRKGQVSNGGSSASSSEAHTGLDSVT